VPLEHLIVVPRGGLANRMRAISAGRRVCAHENARLTAVWEWCDPLELFAPGQGVEWLRKEPPREGYLEIRHRQWKEGGDRANRKVPTWSPRVLVRSQYAFCAETEEPIGERALGPHQLEPAAAIRDRVEEFTRSEFRGRRVVGLHIRRTDNVTAIDRSPDELFRAEARAALATGALIFLATDNAKTEAMIRDLGRQGEIITYPKRSRLAERWPRPTAPAAVDVVDDFTDLLLLAACDHVIGSAGSSFTRQAIVRNGSERCRVVVADPPPGREGKSWGVGEL
jgi:hypothetical protein